MIAAMLSTSSRVGSRVPLVSHHEAATTIARIAAAPATTPVRIPRDFGTTSARSSSATAAAPGRCDGSAASRRATRASSAGVVSARIFEGGVTVVIPPPSIARPSEAPGNGRWPVVISYSRTPSAKRSDGGPASAPAACSGAMYAGVPMTARGCVRVGSGVSVIFARPKSSTFMPCRVIITLPGLRSRCTMPARCASVRASAICAPYRSTSSIGNGPLRSRAASVSPSISSITR